jgi:cytidylate kinase
MHKLTIAIDGPAGSGKSTVAKTVAKRLGYTYIDTGAMYRAAACASLQRDIPVEDAEAVVGLTNQLSMRFETADDTQKLYVDNTDVSEAIRTPEVTRLSSPVSAIPGVRVRLVEMQREMGKHGGVVMEGRDIGTVVFPNAEIKVFMTASAEERAKRRCNEMLAKGLHADLGEVAAQMRERDLRDSTRQHSPLTQAEDAVRIDTDGMSIEDVVETVLKLHDERVKELCTG